MNEKKPDYAALDAAIVARLKDGPKMFTPLYGGDVRKEADALEASQEKVFGRFPKPAYRFVDTRVQALRKKEVIVFNSKTGWSLKNDK